MVIPLHWRETFIQVQRIFSRQSFNVAWWKPGLRTTDRNLFNLQEAYTMRLTLEAIYVLCVDKSVIYVKSDWPNDGFVCRKRY